MRSLRQVALAILFAGWMLPAALAQSARARVPRAAALPRPPGQAFDAVRPPATPAEHAASLFTTIAVVWFVIALVYAVVLTVRLRRTLVN